MEHCKVVKHLPDSEVHVVTSREDISGVAAESRSKHPLHSLGVVDFSGVAAIVGKDAHRSVISSGHKLSTSGGVVHIHHSRHKVLSCEIVSSLPVLTTASIVQLEV